MIEVTGHQHQNIY